MDKKIDYKDKPLFRSTLLVTLIISISKILGFVRDALLSKYFGVGISLESFLTAFQIPNFVRKIFIEGTIAQVLVPCLNKEISSKRLKYLFCNLFNFIGLIFVAVSFFGIIFIDIWQMIFAPGFYYNSDQIILYKNLAKIMMPCILFISTSGLLSALLNKYERFNVTASITCILNAFVIFTILISGNISTPIYMVAWGVLISTILQSFVLFIYMKDYIKPQFLWRSPKLDHPLKKILGSLVVSIPGGCVIQISLLLNVIFASSLISGSLSWIYYPDRINQLPLEIFGITISTVILTRLSSTGVSEKNFDEIIKWGVKLSVISIIPFTFAISMLSAPILITLFHYGKFNALDVLQSQKSLIIFSVGLVFFMFIKIYISALYAKGYIKIASNIGLICIMFNIIINIILILLLKEHYLGHLALIFSTLSIAATNALLLFLVLRKMGYLRWNLEILILIIKVVFASSFMLIILYYLNYDIFYWLSLSFEIRLVHLSVMVIIGIFSYLIFLFSIGMRFHHVRF